MLQDKYFYCSMLTINQSMTLNTAIFDMDGLLIDSEPLWQEAGTEVLSKFGISLSDEQYHATTGLRTPEWIAHWFSHFGVHHDEAPGAIVATESLAIEKIRDKGVIMPGVKHIMGFFKERKFQIGLASSSPMRLIEVVVEKLQLAPYLEALTSAEALPYGKPHPQVFMDCATALGVAPQRCIVFEDSFNGVIAAKAAKMKCVVIPAPHFHHQNKWNAADLKLSSLAKFGEEQLKKLEG